MHRRDLLRGGAAAGALLLATPRTALARGFLQTAEGEATSRRSRLFPDNGTLLAHADLHNHSRLSDGAGRAVEAFEQLRAAGMDVAALTDHAGAGSLLPGSICDACSVATGIDETAWQLTRNLADGADRPGEFVAIRGFEWTTGDLGHLNVWFSEQWTDPVATGAAAPRSKLEGFYDWLAEPSGGHVFGGGGGDGLCGFNHPNVAGNFDEYRYVGEVADRIVSCEMLNGRADYLYRGTERGLGSPLNECLNAGWRVGMLGVTDEHGGEYDVIEGKGRAGLWLKELTRDGVREALEARRFSCTRMAGLRLDASAGGIQMGGDVHHRGGPLRIEVDVDKGPSWYGKRLLAQVLTAGPAGGMPTVARVHELRVPGPDEPVVAFDVDLSPEDSPWAVLRLTDPEAPASSLAKGDYAGFGNAVAYASPWWLQPAAGPEPSTTTTTAAAPPTTSAPILPITGRGTGVGVAALAAGAALAARWAARPATEHAHPHDHDHPHGDGHHH